MLCVPQKGGNPGIIGVMPLLGPKPLRALAFVEALTSEGVQPSLADVNAFVEARTSLWDYDPMREGLMVSAVDYLVDARLLRHSNGTVELTPAGAALLHQADPDTRWCGRSRGASLRPFYVRGGAHPD